VVIAYEKYANTRRDYDEWVASSVTISTNYAQNIVFNSFLRFVEWWKLVFLIWNWKRRGKKLNVPKSLLDLTVYKAERIHLSEQMAEVMTVPVIERDRIAKQHHLPYCRYWKRVVQKLIRQMRTLRFQQQHQLKAQGFPSEVTDVKVRINELFKYKSEILKSWQHNLVLETTKQRKRLQDLGIDHNTPKLKQEQSVSHLVFRGKSQVITSDELEQWEKTGEHLNYRLERYASKVRIEKIIRDIRNVYRKENLSFSNLMHEVWLNLKDDEKLVFLSVDDLAAIMSPKDGCSNASEEEFETAAELIRNYQVICRPKRKTLKRFPRLSQRLCQKLEVIE